MVRYQHIKIPYFYMNDYLYSFDCEKDIKIIRNRYPFRIENNNKFEIKINIDGSLKELTYLKMIIDVYLLFYKYNCNPFRMVKEIIIIMTIKKMMIIIMIKECICLR